MVALAVEEPAMIIEWTGAECVVHADAESSMPLTSSSMKGLDVVAERKKQFQKLTHAQKLDEQLLYQFHRSHLPARGPSSVCMHRDDAATVSLSAVNVTPESIEFSYHGAPPCSETQVESIRIKRTEVVLH